MRIELQQVSVERGGRTILDGIDLTIPAGQVTLVLGRSGAGLSSLLKVAAGLLAPTTGRVLQDDVDLAGLAGRALQEQQVRSGFVFQDAALWANTNLLGNLDLPLQARFPQLAPAARHERIDSLLNSLGFSADLMQRPAMLSMGQQKLVSFLRAAVTDPEVLFLDEALASLDRHWREQLAQVVHQRQAGGVTVLAAAHDLQQAGLAAQRLVVLEGGRILAAGTVADVQQSRDVRVKSLVHGV